MLSYYSRFLLNLTDTLFPLYRLLKRDTKWKEEAFTESKKLLISSEILTHFDPKLDLVLSCDASAYGIGAVLAHKLSDGMEKPFGYVSRTLTESEKNYSQLEKEALACIYGVTKFHSYLFGHPFTLLTDHLPLKSLFNKYHAVPVQASARIQRWALILSSYEYT